MSSTTNSWTDEFQKLWFHGERPSVEQFLACHETVSIAQLTELLILDQSLHWEIDNATCTEEYFVRFPEMLSHKEFAIDLVFSEFLLMERSAQNPSIEEFADRFPQFSEELRRQAAFHWAIGVKTESDAKISEFPWSTDRQPVESLSKAPDVPGYKILSELGRGGIGVVYKAIQLQLNRPVALKMLLAGHFASESLLRRFLVEAEATARLQHPNIVQIYEVGQFEGRPFLALEFINGGTLAQFTSGRPQPPREVAKLLRALASTVQFAHENGVVHRDLKPSNVLIQQLGRPPSLSVWGNETKIKIADFGLAKLLASGTSTDQVLVTMSGDVLGTAAYMSPEQARGDSATLSASTDVYSLGAVLYELLTGRPPFVGVQPLEVLGQVIADEPVRPSHLVRRLPKDVQTICLKCLQKSPARRYDSAGELADDLGRFLNNQPIVARHSSAAERSLRWCRRHPAKTSLVASIVTLLVLVVSISIVYSMILGHQLTITSEARNKEQSARIQSLQQLWQLQLAQADAIRNSKHFGQKYDALVAINAARELGKSICFTDDQMDRMTNATIACLALPDIRVVGQWTPDGGDQPHDIVTVDKRQNIYAFLQSRDRIVVQRSMTGVECARIPVTNPDSIPLLSGDGKRLAVLNDHCRVYALDTERPELVFETASQGVWGFTADARQMLGTGGDGVLSLVDLDNAKVIKTYGAIAAKDEIAISPDARRAAVFDGNSIMVIELDSGSISLEIKNSGIRGRKHFAWHPNSNYLAIGPFVTEGIELWDVDNGVRINTLYHDTGELGIDFDSNGERLLTYDFWGGSLLMWNISGGEVELSKVGIRMRAVSADDSGGFRLLQLLDDGELAEVLINRPRIYATLPLIRSPGAAPLSNDLAYSPDGQLLAVVNRGELQIFDTRNYNELDRLICGFCYFHFDRNQSLVTSNQAGVARWELSPVPISDLELRTSATAVKVELGPPVYLSDSRAYAPIDISRDGQTIAIPTGNEVQVDSVGHPEKRRTIGPHNDIRRLSISPNGQQLVTGGWEGGKACVWDIATGTLLHTFEEPDCCLVGYSPDGKWLVTNADRVRIWNAETWALAADLSVDGISVSGVQFSFSPDSRILAVSDSSAHIILFDPTSGRKMLVLTDPNEHLASQMVFKPDGSQLAVLSLSRGAVVHVWDLAAIRDELTKRQLECPWSDSLSAVSDSGYNRNGAEGFRNLNSVGLQIVPDQRFIEIAAARQYDQLTQSVEKFDIRSARAAMATLIKLRPHDAFTCNNLAWILVTGPQPLRDSATAVEFARLAMADESAHAVDRALFINTLGVALYRDNKIEEASGILERSLAMQPPESQPFDLFFLSMCCSRLDNQDKAREYFDRAKMLMEQFRLESSKTWQNELTQFAEEARLLLDNCESTR